MKLLLRLRVESLHLLIQRDESLGHQLDLRHHVLRHDVEVPTRFSGPGIDKNLQALTLIRDERLQARAMLIKGRVNVLANSCLDGVNMPARLGGAGLNLLTKFLANLGGARLDLPAKLGGTGLDFLAQFLANFIQGRVARVPVHGS